MDKKFPIIAITCILFSLGILGFIYWSNVQEDQTINANSEHVSSDTALAQPDKAAPTPLHDTEPVVPEIALNGQADVVADTQAKQTKTEVPTPPSLNRSDKHIKNKLASLSEGQNIVALLTDEEIIRKLVRAIYGVSQGRIVRQYRPLSSPEGNFVTNKIGQRTEQSEQELYRISRDNYSRYITYISLLSLVDKDALVTIYDFYRPTFEEAYKELGIATDSFHSTLLKAIDMMLNAPDVQEAILLTRPSVRYKFYNEKFEKLPPVHKLMLRIGGENSEALKLELREIKKRLIQI